MPEYVALIVKTLTVIVLVVVLDLVVEMPFRNP
jgi:hypothetical protein